MAPPGDSGPLKGILWMGSSQHVPDATHVGSGGVNDVHIAPDFSFLGTDEDDANSSGAENIASRFLTRTDRSVVSKGGNGFQDRGKGGRSYSRHHRHDAPQGRQIHKCRQIEVDDADASRARRPNNRMMVTIWVTLHLLLHGAGYRLVIRKIWHDHATLAWVLYSTGLGCCCLYAYLLQCDPGTIRAGKGRGGSPCSRGEHKEPGVEAAAGACKDGSSGVGGGWCWCHTCDVPRPTRSKHCAKCLRCVLRFDHHCPWIGGDVGVGNHLPFLAYVATQTVHMGVGFALCLIYFRHYTPEGNHAGNSYLGFVWSIILGALGYPNPAVTLLIAVGSLGLLPLTVLVQQLVLVSRNLLVNESINRHRYEHFRHGNPFDKGIIANWREFLTETWTYSRGPSRFVSSADRGYRAGEARQLLPWNV
ncbi:unnamed protein product [Discosporangium mesarthrocarpum]